MEKSYIQDRAILLNNTYIVNNLKIWKKCISVDIWRLGYLHETLDFPSSPRDEFGFFKHKL